MYSFGKPQPFKDELATGRKFITPCCTSATVEFLGTDGQLYLATRVAGHGWSEPRLGKIEDINDTGTIVNADGTEKEVRWDARRDAPRSGQHSNMIAGGRQ